MIEYVTASSVDKSMDKWLNLKENREKQSNWWSIWHKSKYCNILDEIIMLQNVIKWASDIIYGIYCIKSPCLDGMTTQRRKKRCLIRKNNC